jgi:hypothetical protein
MVYNIIYFHIIYLIFSQEVKINNNNIAKNIDK